MNILDNQQIFQLYCQKAMDYGFIHARTGVKKLPVARLMTLLADSLGQVQYRRFHMESINRAYGIAFTYKAKMQWAKDRGFLNGQGA